MRRGCLNLPSRADHDCAEHSPLGSPDATFRKDNIMLRKSVGGLAACASLVLIASSAAANATAEYRLSGPVVHENLAIYFVHGASVSGPVPLSLEESLAKNTVNLRETGNVNRLEIENVGDDEVFVQSGDIVKGGQQDRVLTVSLLLPPHSGRIAIAAYCVEQGRWFARGNEDARRFSSAAASMPTRDAKIAMKAPAPPGPAATLTGSGDTGTRQQAMWRNVASIQDKLSRGVGAPVAATQSQTSLQLALENEKVRAAQRAYIEALQPAGEKDADIVGYVFAINGKINSAEIYPSNALFRKMWRKLLSANATEAIAERNVAADALPSIDAVRAFLGAAESGNSSEKKLTDLVSLETREADRVYYFETKRTDGRWLHRNYLAK
jgi:hypothetical protein